MIEGGFGLYVHWPFCQSKCPYCDFNSHVTPEVDQTAWRDALVSEISRYGRLVPNRILQTMFFGGGTPSLMPPDTVAAVIDAARAAWPTSNDMEITLEANPTSVEAGKFRAFRQAGVNRISMGIQALNDADLKRLGRRHTVKEAQTAFEIARSEFDRVSFDLIYARQDQTLTDWRVELNLALSMAVDHLSLYQLTIEDGTAFGDRFSRGLLRGLPDDDRAADMYEATQHMCENAGMLGYETSNHASLGAESAHNLIYWRYGDYVGIGPGAHGRLTLPTGKITTEALRQPGAWLNAVRANTNTADIHQVLPLADQATELMMMGLRLSEGVSLQRYERLSNRYLPEVKLTGLVELRLIEISDDRLTVSKRGRPLLNAILRDLLID